MTKFIAVLKIKVSYLQQSFDIPSFLVILLNLEHYNKKIRRISTSRLTLIKNLTVKLQKKNFEGSLRRKNFNFQNLLMSSRMSEFLQFFRINGALTFSPAARWKKRRRSESTQ